MAGKGILSSLKIGRLVAGAIIGAGVGATIANYYVKNTTPTYEQVLRYEADIQQVVNELREKNFDVYDICRKEAAQIFQFRTDLTETTFQGNLLSGPYARIRIVEAQNKAATELGNYLKSHPEILLKLPVKKLQDLEKRATKLSVIKEGFRPRQDRLVRGVGIGGIFAGVSLAALSQRGTRQRLKLHTRKSLRAVRRTTVAIRNKLKLRGRRK